jgi:hypothetical protein
LPGIFVDAHSFGIRRSLFIGTESFIELLAVRFTQSLGFHELLFGGFGLEGLFPELREGFHVQNDQSVIVPVVFAIPESLRAHKPRICQNAGDIFIVEELWRRTGKAPRFAPCSTVDLGESLNLSSNITSEFALSVGLGEDTSGADVLPSYHSADCIDLSFFLRRLLPPWRDAAGGEEKGAQEEEGLDRFDH